jgi:hypothetical protein
MIVKRARSKGAARLLLLGALLLLVATGTTAKVAVPVDPAGVRQRGVIPGAQAESSDKEFWCPMHPSIRSGAPGKCALCGMQLIEITNPTYIPYRLDVEVKPRQLRSGQRGRLKLLVRDPRTDAVVQRFEPMHERIFHLFVISHDLQYFQHAHPVLKSDGSLELDIVLPRPGPYQLYGDFLPSGGFPQFVQKSLITADFKGSLTSARSRLAPDVEAQVDQGLRVSLDMSKPIAGREQLVRCVIHDAATGAPVTDLEPFLGAPGHMLIVSEDLVEGSHTHPVEGIASPEGPEVVFQVLFPRAVQYRVWAQFQRGGRVVTVAFTIPVSPVSALMK